MAGTNHGISWTILASGAGLAFVIVGAGWTLFQDKFSQAEKADARTTVEIMRLRDELLTRRHEFVTIEQFQDIKERLAGIEKRLDVLEQTRPTTPVLEAVSKGTEAQLGRFEDRLRILERNSVPNR